MESGLKKRWVIVLFGSGVLICVLANSITIPYKLQQYINYQWACLTKQTESWVCLSHHGIDEINISGLTGDLWGVSNEIMFHFPSNSQQGFGKTQIINVEKVGEFPFYSGFCANDKIWLINSEKINDEHVPAFYSYDPDTGVYSHPLLPENLPKVVSQWYCFSSDKGELVFWNTYDIGIYDGASWQSLSFELADGEYILAVKEDRHGNLWAFTLNGRLLRRSSATQEWSQHAQIDLGDKDWSWFMLLDIDLNDEYLWVVYQDEFYRFPLNQHTGQLELIYKNPEYSLFSKVYVDELSNNIWVIFDKNIITVDSQSLKAVPFPIPTQDGYNNINDIVVDPTTRRLYIATTYGVYYLDIQSD
ncbi:MAG: hypothetical protein OEZ02_04425 [Anaerolineae bacterium]|nr:hypothetical protein [Anaerolineae bacterium]